MKLRVRFGGTTKICEIDEDVKDFASVADVAEKTCQLFGDVLPQ